MEQPLHHVEHLVEKAVDMPVTDLSIVQERICDSRQRTAAHIHLRLDRKVLPPHLPIQTQNTCHEDMDPAWGWLGRATTCINWHM
jgi:hypothetical protein